MTTDPRGAENRTESDLFASLRAEISTATLDEQANRKGNNG
jgi:hypothetical protein